MNKKLVNLAVAAALAAPAAAMADATLYGKLHVSIDYADVTNAIAPVLVDPQGNPSGDVIYLDPTGRALLGGGQDFKGWGANAEGDYIPGVSRANRLGVKGSEDLGGGLKAIYQVEFGVNFADDNVPSGSNGGVSIRNSFVGLAGGWGTFLVGRHDTPFKISTGKLDLFADTMADYNGTVGFEDLRVDNAIAYISPSFSGFQLAAAVVSPGGATAGEGLNINSDSLASAYSLAGIYKNGPFYASAAYESINSEHGMDSATSLAGDRACFNPVTNLPTRSCDYVNDDYTKWRVGLGLLDWNGFTLTAIYEDQDNRFAGQTRSAATIIDANGNIALGSVTNGVSDQQLWQVQAGYAFGNNMIKGMYGSVDRGNQRFAAATRESLSISSLRKDLNGDRSTWAVAFDHNFSKRTKAYVLYTSVDDDNTDNPYGSGNDWDGFSLGMIHNF